MVSYSKVASLSRAVRIIFFTKKFLNYVNLYFLLTDIVNL